MFKITTILLLVGCSFKSSFIHVHCIWMFWISYFFFVLLWVMIPVQPCIVTEFQWNFYFFLWKYMMLKPLIGLISLSLDFFFNYFFFSCGVDPFVANLYTVPYFLFSTLLVAWSGKMLIIKALAFLHYVYSAVIGVVIVFYWLLNYFQSCFWSLNCTYFDIVLMLAFRHQTNLENNKRVDLFDGPNEGFAEDNVLLASCKNIAYSWTWFVIALST